MLRVALVSFAVLAAASSSAGAQNRGADEKAIRAAIDLINSGRGQEVPSTPDRVFWSGALVRPNVRGEKPEPRANSSAGNRSNEKTAVTVNQLHVSASGDMAYEYSTFKSSWVRNDTKQTIQREGGLLRVWRKIDGKWHIAASFQQPYNNTPAEG